METCTICGSVEDVEGDLCEECADSHVWCSICRSWKSEDGHCRHLFWSDAGWAGSGSDEVESDYLRESFLALLDLLALVPREGRDGWCWSEKEPPGTLIEAMQRRLQGRGFWTFTHGFMLSLPDLDLVEERPDLPEGCGPLAFAHVRASVVQEWQRDHADLYERASDGFSWLVSLEAERTPAANALTAHWIDGWKTSRENH